MGMEVGCSVVDLMISLLTLSLFFFASFALFFRSLISYFSFFLESSFLDFVPPPNRNIFDISYNIFINYPISPLR